MKTVNWILRAVLNDFDPTKQNEEMTDENGTQLEISMTRNSRYFSDINVHYILITTNWYDISGRMIQKKNSRAAMVKH